MNRDKIILTSFMKTVFTIVIILFINDFSFGQLQNVEPYFGYTKTLSNRLEVDKIDAVGGGAKIQFELKGNLSIRLDLGYKLYSIRQPNEISKWKWFFWDARYQNTIESNLKAFKELSVDIGSIQKMDIIPVLLDLTYAAELSDDFTLYPSIGGGIYFYTRRLYITESWSKNFEEVGYIFNYSYRNFTPDKKGNPIVAFAGLEMNYALFKNFHLKSEVRYTQVFETESMGFDQFPFDNEMSFNIGINILY